MTNPYEIFRDQLKEDPKKLKKFLRDVMGPPRRIIEGVEKEHMLTVFSLIEPTSNSNNQRTWTDVYHHAGKEYHLTTSDGFDELEEILQENDDEKSRIS